MQHDASKYNLHIINTVVLQSKTSRIQLISVKRVIISYKSVSKDQSAICLNNHPTNKGIVQMQKCNN